VGAQACAVHSLAVEMMDWRKRATSGEHNVTGVPAWLLPSVCDWTEVCILRLGGTSIVQKAQVALQMQLYDPGAPTYAPQAAARLAGEPTGRGLPVVDFVLSCLDPIDMRHRGWANDLESTLSGAGHELAVFEHDGGFMLSSRTPPETTAMVVKASGTAGAHLQEAWADAYGRDPSEADACRKAILAVEAALKPIVQPNHAGATLGTMLGELRSNPGLFQFAMIGRGTSALPDTMDMFIKACAALWPGPVRHGVDKTTEVVAIEEARTAAALAAWIVTTVQVGGFKKR